MALLHLFAKEDRRLSGAGSIPVASAWLVVKFSKLWTMYLVWIHRENQTQFARLATNRFTDDRLRLSHMEKTYIALNLACLPTREKWLAAPCAAKRFNSVAKRFIAANGVLVK